MHIFTKMLNGSTRSLFFSATEQTNTGQLHTVQASSLHPLHSVGSRITKKDLEHLQQLAISLIITFHLLL